MSEIARLDVILSGDAKPLVASLDKADAAVSQFGKKMSVASNTAANSLTNLGRVAQDLPFGFVGIQNNLNPLLESFQRLKAETGSTGGALKALGKSLMGAGGLGFALSVASSAFLLYSQYAQKAEKETNALGDAIAETTADLNTELTKMSALIQVARNVSESTEARKNAIDQLQKLYPGYLSNINLENVNSQEAARAIGMLTAALERKAKVQAYGNLLTKASEDLIKAQNGNVTDNIGLLDYLSAAFKGSGNASLSASKLVESGINNQTDAIKVLQQAVSDYSKALSDLTQEQARNDDFKLLDPTKAKAPKKIKVASDFFLADTNIKDISEKFINAIAVETGNQLQVVQRTLDGKPLEFKFKAPDTTTSLDELFKKYEALVGITKELGAVFGDVFNELITTGRLSFKAVTQAITGMITKLIAAVVQAALLTAILQALGFATGGFSAVLGKVLGLGNLIGHAEGGIFAQPTVFGNHAFGEKGPEALIPLDRMNEFGVGNGMNMEVSGTLRAQGTELVAVINRANLRNQRNYGNNFNQSN